MARGNGSSGLGYLGVGVVTIAAGAALGYYVIGGAHPQRVVPPAPGLQEVAAPETPPPTTHRVPRAKAHVTVDSDYTAPGAPRIHIVEDDTPTVGSASGHPPTAHSSDTNSTDIPTPDVEASQEAASSSTSTPDSTTGTDSSTVPDASSSPSASEGTTASTPPPPNSATPSPLNTTSPTGTAPGNDSEASQAGTASPTGHAQYRIQAGSFSNAQDAQNLVNTLQGKGVDAAVSAQHEGGQTIYKVQVGAYRDHGAAEQAASGFRHQGVPVSVDPITP